MITYRKLVEGTGWGVCGRGAAPEPGSVVVVSLKRRGTRREKIVSVVHQRAGFWVATIQRQPEEQRWEQR